MADRDISEKTRRYIASGYRKPVDVAVRRSRKRRAYEAARFVLSVIAMALAIAFTYTLAPTLLVAAAAMMAGLFVIDGVGFVAFTAVPWLRRFAEGRGRDGDDGDGQPKDDIPVYAGDTIRALVARWLRRRFNWRWVASTALTVAFVVCLLRHVGAFMLPDDGLAPLIRARELVVFSKRVEAAPLRRGDWIVFRFADDTAVGRANQPTLGRIVAGPGDVLAIEGDQFTVGGEAAGPVGMTADQRLVFAVPDAPASLAVPAGCWFVVCEQAGQRLDSRLLGWARRERLMGAELVIVSRQRFGVRLDEPAGGQ